VAIIGGGNTAMDSCRTARRMGAEKAFVVYRRSEAEMPARVEEVKHAKEEGVEFLTLCNPVEYLADESGRVRAMRLQRMTLGEPDESGRRSPVPIEGAIDEIEVDMVIVSVGVSPNPLIPNSIAGLEVSRRGTIVADESTLQSSLSDLYAGGDIVRGGATVILAMGDGRKAAASMAAALLDK
jgi:glutamate synthase (NADPH/NADH) small chain